MGFKERTWIPYHRRTFQRLKDVGQQFCRVQNQITDWVQRYLRSILPTLRSIIHFVEKEVSIFLRVDNPQITY